MITNGGRYNTSSTSVVAAVFAAAFTLIAITVSGNDWPCYRGPNSDGHTDEKITIWPPQEAWRANVGQGFSEVVVSHGKVYAFGWSNNQNIVSCYSETSSGANPAPVWKTSYSSESGNNGGTSLVGTYPTPAVDGGKVYTFDNYGILNCYDAASGALSWSSSAFSGGGPNGSASPWVEGDLVLVNAGGNNGVGAISKTTHNVVWGANGNGERYTSPFAATIGTQRTIIGYGVNVTGLDPASGNVLWFYPNPVPTHSGGVANPMIVNGNQLFVSEGYNSGSRLFNLTGVSGQLGNPVWRNNNMCTKENAAVLYNGYAYGPSEPGSGQGLTCLNLANGNAAWQQNGYAPESAVLSAGDQLICMTGDNGGNAPAFSGNGDLVVVQASPSGYTELHRLTKVLNDYTWTVPTLCNGKLYLHSRDGTLICYTVGTSSGGTAPVITSATTANGTVGQSFSYQITANGSPTSYNATGLPAGLSINTGNGLISGTPTTAGNSSVTISAINGSGTGQATLSLTIAGGGGGGSGSKMAITFSGYHPAAPGTLTNFPALVVLGANNSGFSYGQMLSSSDGADLRFYSADMGTELKYEIDTWNPSGTSYVWVQVPALSSASDYIWASWGNPNNATAPAYRSNGGAWDSTFVGVWHMSETVQNGGIEHDSTANHNDAVFTASSPSTSGVAAVIGNGNHINSSGGLLIHDNASLHVLEQATWSIWAKSDNPNSVGWQADMMDFQNDLYLGPHPSYGNSEVMFANYDCNNGRHGTYYSSTNIAVWNYWGGVNDSVSGKQYIYFNGYNNIDPTFGNGDAMYRGDSVTTMGHGDGSGLAMGYNPDNPGTKNQLSIDEARMESVARSSNWMWSCYMTMALNSSFETYGSVSGGGGGGSAPSITSSTTANGTVGSSFSYQITASGSPTSYNATGLPAGLSVNTGNGLISGTPTASGNSSVTISASNSKGTGQATLTLTIGTGTPAPTITSPSTASGTVGQSFSYQITASGSPTSFNATGLPAGLSVNTGNGLISGTPTAAGNSTVTISATSVNGTGQATLSLSIGTQPVAPVITSSTSAIGVAGIPFSYQITASGSPTSYNASGLPAGLGINTGSGLISGTPTADGTNSVTISAINSVGTGNATLTLTINPVGSAPVGLVGWWKLDESSGTTAADSSGNGNNGTLGGGTWQTSGGRIAGALSFSSISEFVDCGASASLNTPSMTIAFWMKPSQLAVMGPVDKLPMSTGTGYAVRLRDTGAIWFRLGCEPGSQVDVYGAANSYAAGVWTHVAATFDSASGSAKLYVNGALAGQATCAYTLSAATTHLLLAKENKSSNEGYPGALDDVRVYDHALTPGEIATVMAAGGSSGNPPAITSATTASGTVGQTFGYQITASGSPTSFNATGLPAGLTVNTTSGLISGTPTAAGNSSVTISAINGSGTGQATLSITINAASIAPTGLVGWWKLDENSGATAADSSGNGNNGTLSGGTWQTSGGHLAGALHLNALDVVNCGAAASLNTPSVTVAFWMKPDSIGNVIPVDKLPSTGSVGYAVKLRDNGSIWFRVGAEGGPALDVYGASGIYSAGTWVHVACTFDSGSGAMRMYINGVVQSHQPAFATTLNASTTAFRMGSTTEPYAGLLDDVRVYDHALTAGEIATVMAGGSGGVQPPVVWITPKASQPGMIQLSWQTASGTMYAVYKTTNLLAGWPAQPLTNIVGDGAAKAFSEQAGTSRTAYYCLKAVGN